LPRISSSPDTPSSDAVRWPQLYLGLGITTCATLVLELSLTRIFAAVFYPHAALLAITIALCGLAAGGVFSYAIAARRGNLGVKLGTLSVANGFAVVASVWFLFSRPAGAGIATVVAVFLVSAVPFFFAGAIVSLAISEAIQRIDRAYSFDRAGAAVGCLALIPSLNVFGGPNTVIAAGVLYAVAAAIWFHQAGAERRRASAVLVALMLVTLMVVNFKAHFIDVHFIHLQASQGHDLPSLAPVVAAFASIALTLLLPRLLFPTTLPKHKGVIAFLLYFLCLGAGYVLIQTAFVQTFALLLGRPAYAFTLILFPMLAVSGVGSYFSPRIALRRVLAGVAILIAILAFVAAPLTLAAATWPMTAKILLTLFLVAAPAFLLGMPFPSGLRRLEEIHPPSVRWAWSLHAAAFVLGSTSVYANPKVTLLLGSGLYATALLAIWRSADQPDIL
jgi:hypothetical protein